LVHLPRNGSGISFLIRQTRHGVVLASPPRRSTKPPTEAQLQARERFRRAIQYAKGATGKEEYQRLALLRGTSPFAIARKDFLNPPRILEINLARYHGKLGDIVEVRATDTVKVDGVALRIVATNAREVERGEMIPSREAPELWLYVASVDAPDGELAIEVEATDLAGNRTVLSRSYDV
jgi:hypothetical protein